MLTNGQPKMRHTETPYTPVKPSRREIELKFLMTEPVFKAARQWEVLCMGARKPPAQRLRSVYFDTEDGALRRHKMVLRTRNHNRAFIMTFKWSGVFAGGPFERGEIETPMADETPDTALLGDGVAKLIAEVTAGSALIPIYVTDIKRAIYRIHAETSDIEVSFDTGTITAGDAARDVREVEMELKSGDVAALYRIGIAFAEAFPVQLNCIAKSERGALLYNGQTPEAVRAAGALMGTPTVDEAIGAVINACIAQFIGNWPAFEEGDGVKAVHQMRVAMRRLRSIISLFRRSFPCAEFTTFQQTAKQIANAMGEARNWDVFIDLIQAGPLRALPDAPGLQTILVCAEERREAGYEAVTALLKAADTTRFILSLQAFVARRGWRNGLEGEALPRLSEPAKDFASFNLARLHHRLARRGKDLLELSPHDRHEVRKDLKKLRYAADLFGGLFANHGQVKAYTRAMADLQDELGFLNDLVTATALVAQLDSANDPDVNRAAGIIIGWCGRGAVVDDSCLRKTWKSFRKAKPFQH